MLIDNCHNYACPVDNIMLSNAVEDDEFPSLPVTPCKPPPYKKPNINSDIVATLSLLINSRCEASEKMVGANTMVIEGLKKTEVCMWLNQGCENEWQKLKKGGEIITMSTIDVSLIWNNTQENGT